MIFGGSCFNILTNLLSKDLEVNNLLVSFQILCALLISMFYPKVVPRKVTKEKN